MKKKIPLCSKYHLLMFLFLLLNVNLTSAKTITVSSIRDLQNAINNANAGHVILFTNGVSKVTSNLIINRAGTPLVLVLDGQWVGRLPRIVVQRLTLFRIHRER